MSAKTRTARVMRDLAHILHFHFPLHDGEHVHYNPDRAHIELRCDGRDYVLRLKEKP